MVCIPNTPKAPTVEAGGMGSSQGVRGISATPAVFRLPPPPSSFPTGNTASAERHPLLSSLPSKPQGPALTRRAMWARLICTRTLNLDTGRGSFVYTIMIVWVEIPRGWCQGLVDTALTEQAGGPVFGPPALTKNPERSDNLHIIPELG